MTNLDKLRERFKKESANWDIASSVRPLVTDFWLSHISQDFVSKEEAFSAEGVNLAFENGRETGRKELASELRGLLQIESNN